MPRQNDRHFPDDIFKCIFVNGNIRISNKISLKIVPKVLLNNIPVLVQIMAWRRPGDKPLSEPMLVSLLMHIWVTWPQWVNERYLQWYVNQSVGRVLTIKKQTDGLVQERCDFIANALELCLSCTNLSKYPACGKIGCQIALFIGSQFWQSLILMG